jgi:hypothetical protein
MSQDFIGEYVFLPSVYESACLEDLCQNLDASNRTQYTRQTQVEYTIGGRKERKRCVRETREGHASLSPPSFLLVIIGYNKSIVL